MIKFFRRTRKKLLSENKISRYLLYAVGEIMLVVIGILIALQINNWNEEQKNKTLEKKYIAGLITDLDYDIKAYTSVIAEIEFHHKSINAVLSCYKERISLPDTILLEHLSNLSFIARFSHRNTVMDDMKSSGRLNLITSDSIRQEITEYYKLASSIIGGNEKNNDWILNHITASPVMINQFDFNSTVSYSDFIPEMMKSIEVDSFSGLPFINDVDNPGRDHIINLLTAKNWLNGLNQRYGISGQKKAVKLKKRLDEYLNHLEDGD